MDNKYNQIVIECVENGFVLSAQTKESNSFFGSKQVDKKHYIAASLKELEKKVREIAGSLISTAALEQLRRKEEEEELKKLSEE